MALVSSIDMRTLIRQKAADLRRLRTNPYLTAFSANLGFFAFNTLFFLIVTPIAVRVMGGEFYGLWAVLNSVLLFAAVGTFGIDSVVNKFSAEHHPEYDDSTRYHGEVISAGLLITVPAALLVSAVLISLRFTVAAAIHAGPAYRDQTATALLLIGLTVIPLFSSRVLSGFLLSQLKNGLVRGIETGTNVSLWSGALIIAASQRNIAAVAAWGLATYLLNLTIYLIVLRLHKVRPLKLNLRLASRMCSFALYTLVSSLAVILFQQSDRLMVAFALGPAAAGVYAVGTSVALRLSLVTGQATDLMIPYASLKSSTGQQSALYTSFRRLSRYLSLAIACLASVMIIWMGPLLALWISSDYSEQHARGFSILLLAYGLLSLSRVGHQTLTGLGRVKFASGWYLGTSIVTLIAIYLLSARYGLIGAAAGNAAIGLLLVFNMYAHMKLHPRGSVAPMLADFSIGIAVPALSFLLSLAEPSFLARLGYTLIVLAGTTLYLGISRRQYVASNLRAATIGDSR